MRNKGGAFFFVIPYIKEFEQGKLCQSKRLHPQLRNLRHPSSSV